MEAVYTFFSEHYPMIGLFIVGCIIGGSLVKYHIGILNTRKKVDKLPCEENKEKLKKIDDRVNELPCDNHREQLSEISMWIMKKDKLMIPTLAPKISPRRLSPAGQLLLDISGGKRCIDDNVDLFLSELQRFKPMTPFDVEEKALAAVLQFKNQPIFNKIKNYIYYSPEIVELAGEKVELSIFSISYVMSIYLRDIYFKMHPDVLQDNELLEFA